MTTAAKINDAAKIDIDNGDYTATWAEFVFYNKEGMDEGELDEIEAALLTKGTYHGGGGAAAEFTLRLIK